MNSLSNSPNRYFSSPLFSTKVLLGILLGLGTILRLKDLTFQSLWLDELHTAIEADPSLSVAEVLYFMRNTDQHPPLYFLSMHFWLQLMGYNDFMLRLFSVLAGVGSIAAMYFLGKELRNTTVGLLAAALVAFNYYGIFYSQEARNYIFAFLFCILSFYYLVRALKHPSVKAGVFYALATTLLLYSHYYSLFAVAAQVVVVVALLLLLTKQYKEFLRCFGAAALVAFLLYAWWLPTLLKIGSISSFWIEKPSPDFFIHYFKEYFGNNKPVVYLNLGLMLVFLGGALYASRRKGFSASTPIPKNLPIIALLLVTWVLVSYTVPYVRSIMATPMLFPRYTIITLPAFLLAIALGIDMLRFTAAKVLMVMALCLLSTLHLAGKTDFYSHPYKQQWREMTLFVAKNNAPNYPIFSDRIWYLSYYFKQFDAPFTPVETSLDLIQHPETKGIWVMSGHGGNPLTPDIEKALDQQYLIKEEFVGVDTWARLYLKSAGNIETYDLALVGGDVFEKDYKVLWTNSKITTAPVHMAPGNYALVLNGYGTKAGNAFPLITVYKNGAKLSDVSVGKEKNYRVFFKQELDAPVTFTFDFVNDSLDEAASEDRNLFIKSAKVKSID